MSTNGETFPSRIVTVKGTDPQRWTQHLWNNTSCHHSDTLNSLPFVKIDYLTRKYMNLELKLYSYYVLCCSKNCLLTFTSTWVFFTIHANRVPHSSEVENISQVQKFASSFPCIAKTQNFHFTTINSSCVSKEGDSQPFTSYCIVPFTL